MDRGRCGLSGQGEGCGLSGREGCGLSGQGEVWVKWAGGGVG